MSAEMKPRGGGLSGRRKPGRFLSRCVKLRFGANTENESPGVPAVGASCYDVATNCTNRSDPTKLYCQTQH